jgi:hypothetical protein
MISKYQRKLLDELNEANAEHGIPPLTPEKARANFYRACKDNPEPKDSDDPFADYLEEQIYCATMYIGPEPDED